MRTNDCLILTSTDSRRQSNTSRISSNDSRNLKQEALEAEGADLLLLLLSEILFRTMT